MKTVLHVNQHNIKANNKGADLPVLTSPYLVEPKSGLKLNLT